ncbi:hypothetical protein PVAP13_1KG111372 [Panicum virgatum]|uniref:Secreted protein n=1 Tax=Panicum virgatum TaxID=38727 RepID=A0A8T0XQB1_PANVG|nr:hypothetical protein PVAP13_1KG111372 [Panicum virgatum]
MGACGGCWLARGIRVLASLQITACCRADREASDQASFLASQCIHGVQVHGVLHDAWIRLRGLLSGSGSPVGWDPMVSSGLAGADRRFRTRLQSL